VPSPLCSFFFVRRAGRRTPPLTGRGVQFEMCHRPVSGLRSCYFVWLGLAGGFGIGADMGESESGDVGKGVGAD
jgi:hypothetical protein